ncbi:MAG: AAA family ATPase [archaeon]
MTSFKELTLENIRSYKNLTIAFESGASLLSGDIGSGKTSILLGLQFALFGLQPGQKGSSILRNGEDFAMTRLKMEIDGELITIERSIRKSKSGSITQDSNFLTTEGNKQELSTSEMKERVISLLNYPKELAKKSNLLYKFTVYMPQEEMKSIIEESPEVRLDTLRYIFGLDRYKRIKENAGTLLKRIKETTKIKEVLVAESNLLREKLGHENENKIKLAKETNNLNIEFKNLILAKQEAEVNLNNLQRNLDEITKTNSELEKNKIKLQGQKEAEAKIKREISAMQKQITQELNFSQEKLEETRDLLEKHKRALEEKNSEFLKLNSEVSVLNSRKEQPLELKNQIISLENCPTCLQTVGQDHKTRISKKLGFEIEDINRELEQKIIEKESVIKLIEKEKELIKGYESDKAILEQNKIKAEHQNQIKTKIQSEAYILDRTTNEIQQLETIIQNLSKQLESSSKSQEEFQIAKEEFKKRNERMHAKEIILATKNKELELLKKKLQELSVEIQEKEKIRESMNKLKELNFWIQKNFIETVDRAEKGLITQVKNEFSNALSKWFAYLASDAFSVELDDSFTPSIRNQDYEMDYAFLSGGERTSVALAYRLALNQVLGEHSNMKTNGILILDEPTEGFSSEQVQKMGRIFEELKYEQMILVSHEQEMDNFVDRVIEIKKDSESKISE